MGAVCPEDMTKQLTMSVLDLIPVRTGQSTGDAFRASVALAQTAEAAGVHRYWVAEHHNMPAVASTNPPVLIAMLAAATIDDPDRLRRRDAAEPRTVGRGRAVRAARGCVPGPDRPRHRPGARQRPGDELGAAARRARDRGSRRFAEHVTNLVSMLEPAGVGLNLQGRTYALRATPQAVGTPAVWLLGSSDYSAKLAAALGLPYVFAHHFSRQRHGRGPGAVSQYLQPLGLRRRAANIPDGQRRGRRHGGGGAGGWPGRSSLPW